MKLRRFHWPEDGSPQQLAGADEVHVWMAAEMPCGPVLNELALTLSQDERQRAARFHQSQDRDRFVFSRALLRHLLAAYTGGNAAEIAFAYGPAGRPSLTTVSPATPLVFNLSHTREMTLIALCARGELGVDVESLSAARDWPHLADRVLSAAERSELAALCEADQPAGFLRAWTTKEAVLKATGEGLMDDLSAIEVVVTPSAPARVRSLRGSTSAATRWSLASFAAAPGHLAAVAFKAPTTNGL